MIQRSRKPVIKTEVVLGSKLVNENNINTKPKKKKPINEFIGNSKLVNENNIVINMPEPVKKKRKKKPTMQAKPEGISDEAKRNFQETASQYARGAYPPIPDSVDVSKIKTTGALNAFTNLLRTTMGLPSVPVAPVPVAPIPVAPIPVAPIPVAPIPVAPIPVAPIPVAPIPVAPIPIATQTEKFTDEEIKIYKLLDILTEFYHDIKNDKNIDKLRYDIISYYIIHESFFRSLSNEQMRIYIINYIELIFPLSFTNQDKRDILEFYIETINKIKNEIKPMKESIQIQTEPDNSITVITEEKDNKIAIINEEKDKLKEYNKRLQLDYIQTEKEKETLKNEIKKMESQFEQEKLALTNAEKKKNEKILKKEITEKEVLIQKTENQTKQIKEILKENDNYSKRLSELEGSNETVLVLNELVDDIEKTNSNLQISNEELQQGKKLLEDEIEQLKEENIKLQEINTEKSKEKQQENTNAIDEFEKITEDKKELLVFIKELKSIEEDVIRYENNLSEKIKQELGQFHEPLIREKDADLNFGESPPVNNEPSSAMRNTPISGGSGSFPVGMQPRETNTSQPSTSYGGVNISPLQSPVKLEPDKRLKFIDGFQTDFSNLKDLFKFIDDYYKKGFLEPKIVKTRGKDISEPTIDQIKQKGSQFFNKGFNKDYGKLKSLTRTKSQKDKTKAPMDRTELSNEFIKDFNIAFPDYFSDLTPITEPEVNKTISPTKEDLKLLKTYEESNDSINILDQLKILYKKYYEKDYIFNPDRSTLGEKIFDIIQDFKKGIAETGTTESTETGTTEPAPAPAPEPEPSPAPEPEPSPAPVNEDDDANFDEGTPAPTEKLDNELTNDEFYNKYYTEGVFNGIDLLPLKEELVKRINKGMGGNSGITVASSISMLAEFFKLVHLGELPIRDPICAQSADRAGLEVCYPSSIYIDYLNQLITNNKIIELDLIYKKATSITPSITLDNEIKIQEIILSLYRPDKANDIDNDFYVWLRQQTPPNPPIKPTTEPTIEPTTENILQKYYEYLDEMSFDFEDGDIADEYVIATGDKFGSINRSNNYLIQKIKDSNYIPTKAKNKDFFKWYNDNQGIIEPIIKTEPVINKPLISDNEVDLCLQVCKATYLDPSARERIAQLDYDDSLSNTEVAIYRDLYTNIIYFGSRGSQTAEDWMQSDLAIVFGSATPNYSPRLNNEITILNQVLSIYRPTTIIYTGQSLAAYLSNELFIYTLKDEPSITQVFSIGFNGGQGFPAYYRNYPFNENFINTHVLQFHVKGDVLSRAQAFAPFGTLVTVPRSSYLIIPNHFLSAFDSFNFEPYKNFVDIGLTIPNPDQVVAEETTTNQSILSETDQEKNLKLMNYFNELWEMNRDTDYYTTELFRTVEEYYDQNRTYFDTIDSTGLREPLIISYIDSKPTAGSNRENDRYLMYPFFIRLYDRLSEPFTITDSNQPEAPPEAPPESTQPEPTQPTPYKTPIGGAIGAVIGGALGGLTSGGNPAVIGGAGASGFLIGDAIQRNLPALPEPTPPPPPRPIYMPPPQKTGTEISPILFGGGRTGGKKSRFGFP